ncbi:MAG: M20 family metallo-hydrolase [Firmicutes bacterium]|nr:M20 family metallo-hydrolase [Bacillota bacterium]
MDYDFNKWMSDYRVISAVGENAEGGIDRLAYTDYDFAARTELLNRAYGMRLQCFLDAAENLWFSKPGTDPDLPPLLIGSHLDTVPNGGRYDGVLGVMAGFQVLRYLAENKVAHRRTVELVAFSCEESSRFNLSTIGSKLACGMTDPEKLKKYKDASGSSPVDFLSRLKYAPESLEDRRKHLSEILGYIELHIEQGPVLETGGIDVGIVESIAAPIRLRVDFTGRSDHSGACPMDLRSDALVGAALTIAEVERLGRSEASSRSVATVGTINVPHQAMNVVPGACTIHVDIRGIDRSSMERIYAGLRDFLQKLREERGLKIEETLLSDEYPVPMDRHLGEIIERNCKKTGLSYRWMPSGAGHDAMNVAKLAPSAMIFIPCVGGISHNLKENVLEKDLRNSIQILYEVVMDICR